MNKRNIKHAFQKTWEDLKTFWAKIFDKIKRDPKKEVTKKSKFLRLILSLLSLTLIFAISHKNCNTPLDNQGGVLTVNAEEAEENYSPNILGLYNGDIYFCYSLGGQKILQDSLLSCFLDLNTYQPVDVGFFTYQNLYYYFPDVVLRNTNTNDSVHIYPAFDYLEFTLVYSSIYGYVGYVVGDSFYPFTYNTEASSGSHYSSAFDIDVPYRESTSLSADIYSINYPIRFVFSTYDLSYNFNVFTNTFAYRYSDTTYNTYTCCSIAYKTRGGSFSRFGDIQVSTDLGDFDLFEDSIYGNYYAPADLLISTNRLTTLYDYNGLFLDVSSLPLLDCGMPNYFNYSRNNYILEIICNYQFVNGYYSSSRLPIISKDGEVNSSLEASVYSLKRNLALRLTYPPAQVGNFPNYTERGLPPYVRYVGLSNTYIYGWKYGFSSGEEYGIQLGQEEGYQNGFDEGYEEGKQDGYEEGANASFNPFESFSKSINSLLNTPLLTDNNGNTAVSIGTLFRVGIGVLLFGVLIKVFLGG